MKRSTLIIILIIVHPILSAMLTNKRNVPFVGDNIAMNKNWWLTLTGISKRLLDNQNPSKMSSQNNNYTNGMARDKRDHQESSMMNHHKGEFCVDVSTYGQIEYNNAKIEVCDSTFAKQCTNKYKEVIRNLKLEVTSFNSFILDYFNFFGN